MIKKNTKDLIRANEQGTCYVGFIVDVDGGVTDVEVLTMNGTLLASLSRQAIKNGPKWNPAILEGKKINTYQIQPVTFKIAEE